MMKEIKMCSQNLLYRGRIYGILNIKKSTRALCGS